MDSSRGGPVLLAVAFLTLHAVAAFVVPSRLWGGSHLAAWPATAGLTFLGVMLAATLLGGSLAPKLPLPPFPGERRTWLVAAVSAITFALLCERHHLYGDGSVLLRSRGMSFTVFRGPVIVKSVAFFVQTVEERLGLSVETAFRLLAVASGVVVVYLCVRLCRNLGRSDAERLILLAALAGSGAWQIFFGHIEYYPLLTVAVMFYLFFAVRALQRQATIWWTWPLFAALLPFHFSALCLAPAQLYVGLSAWRTEGPRRTFSGLIAAAIVFSALSLLSGNKPHLLLLSMIDGTRGFLGQQLDIANERHTFGFLSGAHAMAVGNDLFLKAPLSFLALALSIPLLRGPRSRIETFLTIAAGGCLVAAVVFNPEIGPYRDWDALSPYAFVLSLWAGYVIATRVRAETRTVTWMLLLAAIVHVAPWIIMNANSEATERHVHLVLESPEAWSPYARAYMHEELAIQARGRGDIGAALTEYQAAAAAYPTEARYRLGVANMALGLGNFATAVQEYREALALRPDLFAAQNNLALLLLRAGRVDEARTHAMEAVKIDPTSVEACLTLGDVEIAGGDTLAAEMSWRHALDLRPTSAAARERLESLRRVIAQPGVSAP